MEQLSVEMCAFPGCERPVVPGPEGAGRPARYCELAEHNPQSAFWERRRREAAGESDAGVERPGGDRPVSIAGASLRSVAVRLAGDLERTREAIALLTNSEALEAELAAVRADTQAEVSHAAQQEAIAHRERMQADDAAEAALKAAQQAHGREQAALAREQTAENVRARPTRAQRRRSAPLRTRSRAPRPPQRRRRPGRPPPLRPRPQRRRPNGSRRKRSDSAISCRARRQRRARTRPGAHRRQRRATRTSTRRARQRTGAR